jgi:hypothetical protein
MAEERLVADLYIVEIDHAVSSTSGVAPPGLGNLIAGLPVERKWQNETRHAQRTAGFLVDQNL